MKQILSAFMLGAIMMAMNVASAAVDETEKQVEMLTPIYECKFSMHKNPMYPKIDGKKLAAAEEVVEAAPTAGTEERWREVWADIRAEETAMIEKRLASLDAHLKKKLAKGQSFRPMTDGDLYSLKDAFCTCEENHVAVEKIHEIKSKLINKKEFRVEGGGILTAKDLSCAAEV